MTEDKKGSGFSLIELIVVLGIVGALGAILLCAVQVARSAAASAACKSNLRQVGIAFHGYEAAHGAMPVYDGVQGGTIAPTTAPWLIYGSWYVHLMPFVDQDVAYNLAAEDALRHGWNQSRQEQQPNGTWLLVPHGVFLAAVRQSPQPLLRCQADPSAAADWMVTEQRGYAGTNYLANYNALAVPNSQGLWAVPVRLAQWTDGSSNLILLGEGYATCPLPLPHTISPRIALLGHTHGFGLTPVRYTANTTAAQSQPSPTACDPAAAQSGHRGGMNACMADGSVRVVEAGIDPVAWVHLLLPADGE